MHKTAVVYHYLALYRLPIFLELMDSKVVEFTLFSGEDSDIPIKKIDVNLSKKSIKEGGLRWKFLKNFWFCRKKFLWQSGLISFALKSDYDSFIFLGSPYFVSSWIAIIIVRIRRKKVFLWMHGVYRDKPTLVDWLKLGIFYKLANGFFLYGNRAFSILKRFKVKSGSKMHVIYNSLDYKNSIRFRKILNEEAIREFRSFYFGSPNIPIVVFIGRLNFVKRIDMLITAQHLLFQMFDQIPFNLIVIGDGDEKSKLEKLAYDFKLESNIKFLGEIYDERLNANALHFADLCVTPGEVGLTAIHAMSYGVPVISHNNLDIQMPEVEAIRCGKTGDLFKYGSIESLAETIHLWLSKYPIKSSKVSDACFSIVDLHYNPFYQRKIFESVLLKD